MTAVDEGPGGFRQAAARAFQRIFMLFADLKAGLVLFLAADADLRADGTSCYPQPKRR
ncbi:hypothetical protein HOE425_320372 [Hoeflea sp. EC-HK425]|nr:hypothetical protein HOE425_320372 [Hoeflea sp. EC-HK425]